MKEKITKIATYSLMSAISLTILTGVSGCESNSSFFDSNGKPKGAFVIIEEISQGKYKIKEEFPSNETRIVLKKLDGTEKILTKEELDELIKQENAKIDNGTSNLTNGSNLNSGGLSLGEAILSSAAGAIIGSWIGSKLFNSPSYQNQRQSAYKTPSAYSRALDSFKKKKEEEEKSSSSRSRFGKFFSSKSFGFGG